MFVLPPCPIHATQSLESPCPIADVTASFKLQFVRSFVNQPLTDGMATYNTRATLPLLRWFACLFCLSAFGGIVTGVSCGRRTGWTVGWTIGWGMRWGMLCGMSPDSSCSMYDYPSRNVSSCKSAQVLWRHLRVLSCLFT